MKFEFDFGRILVDDREVSAAEIMDILVLQQKKIARLEHELYPTRRKGAIGRAYAEVV